VQEYLDDHDEGVSEKGIISNLRGRNWNEFDVKAVANIDQRLHVMGDQVRLPKVHVRGLIKIQSRDGLIGPDYYDFGALVLKFQEQVRVSANQRRIMTGQLIPLAPPAGRQRGRNEQALIRPLSK